MRTTAGAQCFPRHACPLYGAILMQLHDHAGSVPALAAYSQNMQHMMHAKPCTYCIHD
nr:MAG TPA: hypothetical protein [Caudoviricetes sp.]